MTSAAMRPAWTDGSAWTSARVSSRLVRKRQKPRRVSSSCSSERAGDQQVAAVAHVVEEREVRLLQAVELVLVVLAGARPAAQKDEGVGHEVHGGSFLGGRHLDEPSRARQSTLMPGTRRAPASRPSR